MPFDTFSISSFFWRTSCIFSNDRPTAPSAGPRLFAGAAPARAPRPEPSSITHSHHNVTSRGSYHVLFASYFCSITPHWVRNPKAIRASLSKVRRSGTRCQSTFETQRSLLITLQSLFRRYQGVLSGFCGFEASHDDVLYKFLTSGHSDA